MYIYNLHLRLFSIISYHIMNFIRTVIRTNGYLKQHFQIAPNNNRLVNFNLRFFYKGSENQKIVLRESWTTGFFNKLGKLMKNP